MNPDRCGTGRHPSSLPPGDREEVEKFAAFLAGDLAYDVVANAYVPVDQVGRPGVTLAAGGPPTGPPPPTPNCPACGKAPMRVLGGTTQAFCGDPACKVIVWNPNDTVAQFWATAATMGDLLDPGPS